MVELVRRDERDRHRAIYKHAWKGEQSRDEPLIGERSQPMSSRSSSSIFLLATSSSVVSPPPTFLQPCLPASTPAPGPAALFSSKAMTVDPTDGLATPLP